MGRGPARSILPNSEDVNEAAFAYYAPLERARQYVERTLPRAIALGDAARAAGLERTYFSSYFHAKVGLRFSQWVAGLRIQRSMAILRSRDETITELALAVGFQDLRSFERAFRRWTAMTPRAYKKLVRPC